VTFPATLRVFREDVFRAIADPTRRGLLDALLEEEGQSMTALGDALPMTRFGVMEHLRVLGEAGWSSQAAGDGRSCTRALPGSLGAQPAGTA